jgi:molybdopterin-guanine dinucleotide biosynthesis protein A
MAAIEGFILIGGQSRRMGTDKSRLLLDGRSFVEHIARKLLAAASSVTIVGGNDDWRVPADELRPRKSEFETQNSRLENFTRVADVYPGWGALGGVHAALSACFAAWALIVACDFPFVTSGLFAWLASLTGDYDAVAPIQSDGIPQPLCALYRVQPCLARAEQLIKSGERKPVALLQSVHTRWVSFAELANLPESDSFFDNINTPEDYARARKKGISTDDVAMG